MGATHGLNEVFVTFLELSAASLGAQLDPVNAVEREKEYGELEAGLSREDLGAYAGMLALLCMAVREQMSDPVDILGDIFHRLGLSNKWNGQFFTPSHICRFMAEITGIADSAAALATGHLKINEPSCGSGAMVISAVGSMVSHAVDYQRKVFFVAQDIDIRCVWMAYIQFCLYGIPAVVLQGNSLIGEVNSCWYSPQGIHVLMEEEKANRGETAGYESTQNKTEISERSISSMMANKNSIRDRN